METGGVVIIAPYAAMRKGAGRVGGRQEVRGDAPGLERRPRE